MDLINNLPDEILDQLFSYLEAWDLGRTSLVCRRFYVIAAGDHLWKLCEIDWSLTELPDDVQSWKAIYVVMFERRYGPYLKCYNRVHRCWQKIFSVTCSRVPVIYTSLLRNGTSEEILNNVQQSLGEYACLPLEYRCSYLLCNGQMLPMDTASYWPFAGLFGAYEEEGYGDYFCTWTDDYGGPQVGPLWHSNQSIFRHCCLSFIWVVKPWEFIIPPMLSHGGVALCIRDVASSPHRDSCDHNDEHESLDGRMVSISSGVHGTDVEFFIYSTSFIEFLESFAEKAAIYPVVKNRFLKFDFNAEGETGPYKITVHTAFFRERSSALPIDESEFHYFHRITMSTSIDAPARETCRMETRHWFITNTDNEVTTVVEPGVIGNYPVLYPGAVFTWLSRASCSTTSGTMRGHFTMKKIGNGAHVHIECPMYKMIAPEFVLG